jgi:hypothetical protein
MGRQSDKGSPHVMASWDAASLAATMRILKQLDADLYNGVRDTMRREARQILEEQRRAVRGLSSAGGASRWAALTGGVARSATAQRRAEAAERKHRGLRERVARGLKIEYRERPTAHRRFIGIRVRMSANAMPDGQERIPKHMNYGGWRHPVYGNRENWVMQEISPPGWFDGTFARMRDQAAAAIGRAIDEAFRKAQQ